MSAPMLIEGLSARGVRLEARGELLHVAATVGVLTDTDRAALAANKRGLMLELGGLVQCADCDRLTTESVGMCTSCQVREEWFHGLGLNVPRRRRA